MDHLPPCRLVRDLELDAGPLTGLVAQLLLKCQLMAFMDRPIREVGRSLVTPNLSDRDQEFGLWRAE
jgi:hypothetical protein